MFRIFNRRGPTGPIRYQASENPADRSSGDQALVSPEPQQSPSTTEDPVRAGHEYAASYVAGLSQSDLDYAFKCIDEMWAENGGPMVRPILHGLQTTYYHAGTIRQEKDLDDWPLYVSPTPKGCYHYLSDFQPELKYGFSAMIAKPVRPLRLVDFSASSIDFNNLNKTPMSRFYDFVGIMSIDKQRAHLFKAWCDRRDFDGFERRNAEEFLLTRPQKTLRVERILTDHQFKSEFLPSTEPRDPFEGDAQNSSR